MTQKYVEKYTVPSESVAGKEYLVSKTEHGEWQCSCKHWTTRHVECKHIKRAIADPEKYRTNLGTTTVGLELNPTRRDSKPIMSIMTDEKELRTKTRQYIRSNGGFWDDDMPTFQSLTVSIWDYIRDHPSSGIDFDRFEQIFSESDFEDYDRAWLKNFVWYIEMKQIPYYQPILKEIKSVVIILDEEKKYVQP